MSFRDVLAAEIRAAGPMPLARAMALANAHYYATCNALGPGGDFVTAPEVSQMFGELIGAWAADLWLRAGCGRKVALVELGPGRGTLMRDVVRTVRLAGLEPVVHLVETSARLRAEQAERVPGATFHESTETLPDDGPLLIVGNEFLDALPVAQFERTEIGWAVRHLRATGSNLAFEAVEPVKLALIPEAIREAPEGSIYERSFAAETVVAGLARRLARQGGAALLIDYGHEGPALGDTLQAIHKGSFADPLDVLGDGDLTAHVDFAACRDAALRAAPVRVVGPVDQGSFLLALGLRQRADRLKAAASLDIRAALEAQVARLAGAAAMGRLFKVMAITATDWPEPAGFPNFQG
jgi:SAM-dependent MidA family methyltransferase